MNKEHPDSALRKIAIPLIFGLAFAAPASHGQFSKGTKLVSGSINLIQSREYHEFFPYLHKLPYASLSSRYLYFVTDHIALGASVDLSASLVKWYSDDPTTGLLTTENTFSKKGFFIEPVARFYFAKSYFLQLALGFGANKEHDIWYGTNTVNTTPLSWSARFGRAIFINEEIALEPSMGYGGYNEKYPAFTIPSTVPSSESVTFGLNLQLYVNKKTKDSDRQSIGFTATPIWRGTRIFGGSAGFSSAKETNVPNLNFNSLYFNLSPQFFYFVTNKLAIGGSVNYAFSKTELVGGNSVQSVSDYLITPSFRYYFYKTLFFQPELSFGSYRQEGVPGTLSGNNNVASTVKISKRSVSLGWALFITRSFALETSVAYQSFNDKFASDVYSLGGSLPSGISSGSNGLMLNMAAQLYIWRK